MKRREAIEKTGWILKSAILTPGLVATIQSCQPKIKEIKNLLVLDNQQYELVKALVDTIIPRTETPSASDVMVPEFFDLLLNDVFQAEVVDQMLSGLTQFDNDCQTANGNHFVKLDAKARDAYLNQIDGDIMSKQYKDDAPFYFTFKPLVITIYFSTEQGMKQNLKLSTNSGAIPSGCCTKIR